MPHRWGTHVIERRDPADAAYLVYTRPGFAIFPGRDGSAPRHPRNV
jgi:hypothetical protein